MEPLFPKNVQFDSKRLNGSRKVSSVGNVETKILTYKQVDKQEGRKPDGRHTNGDSEKTQLKGKVQIKSDIFHHFQGGPTRQNWELFSI